MFKENFLILKFTTGNIWRQVIRDVMKGIRSLCNVESEGEQNKLLTLELKFWFSPVAVRVFRFFIQNFSLFFNFSLSVFFPVYWLFDKNKFCLHIEIAAWQSGIFIHLCSFACSSSFFWILRWKLKDPLIFPVYWILQRLHSNRWVIYFYGWYYETCWI